MLRSLLTLILSLYFAISPVQTKAFEAPLPADDFRAVWVCTVANLDWPSKPGLTVAEMKAEADAIIARSAALNFNAVIFQVRPAADALYKSEYFPWSEALTGTQGEAPAEGFDPLAYWIEKCHEKGLELHAWVNPYRVARSATPKLAANNPAKLNPAWAVTYGDGQYFDPGLPECRKLIIDGIAEIIQNYDVDGIHLDDYFYPYPIAGVAFNDANTFKAYGGELGINDWRRENVNMLIKEINEKVKELDDTVRFGVSPFAIWRNASSSDLGSQTSGLESYSAIYSDSRKWVKEGMLDYIAPQIYWYIGYSVADYAKVLSWWANVVNGTEVDLYIGHAVYREVQGEAGWNGEIMRQLNLNAQTPEVKGSIFFRAGFLNGSLGETIGEYYTNKPAALRKTAPEIKMTTLYIAQPSANIAVTGAKAYTIHGTCDPDKELFLNDELVTNRTPEGFFSCYVALNNGLNTFKFTQEGQQDITRVITVKSGSSGGGTTTSIPSVSAISQDARYYATVTANGAWVYPGPTSTGGSSWLLKNGQKDIITGKSNDDKWVRLSCGAWIETANVTRDYEAELIKNVLSDGVYAKGGSFDVIKWKATQNIASNITFEDGKLNVYLGMQSVVPELNIPSLDDTALKGFTSDITANGTPFYSFEFKDGVKIEGVYTEYAEGEFRVVIKKRKTVSDGAAPLAGFRFVIDAGHGGDDSGALGPMGGAANAEKDINLKHALKLAARLRWLGADVTLTRETDVYLTLNERTEVSRMVNPDLFISIHANSVAETTDSSNIKGLTVWHRNEMSAPLGEHLSNKLAYVNPITTRSKVSNTSNFYVCRPLWTPSVIIETSFICNIWDFAWLISDSRQNEWADKTAAAILAYYSE